MSAGEISYIDAIEIFESLNQLEVIYIDGMGSIPKIWYGVYSKDLLGLLCLCVVVVVEHQASVSRLAGL